LIDWYTEQFLIWYVYVGTIHYIIPLALSITHTCRRTAGSAEALQYESNSHTPTHLHIPTHPTHLHMLTHPTHPLNTHTHRAQLKHGNVSILAHTHTPHSPHTSTHPPNTPPTHQRSAGSAGRTATWVSGRATILATCWKSTNNTQVIF